MQRLPLVLSLVFICFLLASCGQQSAPTSEKILSQSKLAVAKQKSATIDLTTQIKSSGTPEGILAFDKQATIRASGVVSGQGSLINGQAEVIGQSFPYTLRTSPTGTALKIDDKWIYAGSGSVDLQERLSPLNGLLRLIVTEPDKILTGAVTAEGDNKWLFEGSVDGDRYKSLNKANPVVAAKAQAVAEGTKVRVTISKANYLPQTVEISYRGPGSAVAGIQGLTNGVGSSGESSLSLKTSFLAWNRPINLGPSPQIEEQSLLNFLRIRTLNQALTRAE